MPRNSLMDILAAYSQPWPYTDPRATAQGMGTAPSEEFAKVGVNFLPGLGDVVGLAQDAASMYTNPQTRTPGNALLAVAGAIPGIPSVNNRQAREALTYWVQETGSLREAIRQLRQTAKSVPELKAVADYGDQMDEIIRFHKAEDADPQSLIRWFRDRKAHPKNAEFDAAAAILEIENKLGAYR